MAKMNCFKSTIRAAVVAFAWGNTQLVWAAPASQLSSGYVSSSSAHLDDQNTLASIQDFQKHLFTLGQSLEAVSHVQPTQLITRDKDHTICKSDESNPVAYAQGTLQSAQRINSVIKLVDMDIYVEAGPKKCIPLVSCLQAFDWTVVSVCNDNDYDIWVPTRIIAQYVDAITTECVADESAEWVWGQVFDTGLFNVMVTGCTPETPAQDAVVFI